MNVTYDPHFPQISELNYNDFIFPWPHVPKPFLQNIAISAELENLLPNYNLWRLTTFGTNIPFLCTSCTQAIGILENHLNGCPII